MCVYNYLGWLLTTCNFHLIFWDNKVKNHKLFCSFSTFDDNVYRSNGYSTLTIECSALYNFCSFTYMGYRCFYLIVVSFMCWEVGEANLRLRITSFSFWLVWMWVFNGFIGINGKNCLEKLILMSENIYFLNQGTPENIPRHQYNFIYNHNPKFLELLPILY